MSSSRCGVCTRLPTAAIDSFPDNSCFATCNYNTHMCMCNEDNNDAVDVVWIQDGYEWVFHSFLWF